MEAEYVNFRVDYIAYQNAETGSKRYDFAFFNSKTGDLLLQIPTKETYNEFNSWRNWFYPAGEDTLLLTRTCEEYAEASYRLLHANGTVENLEAGFLVNGQDNWGRFYVKKPADPAQIGQRITDKTQWLYGMADQELNTVLPLEYSGNIVVTPKSTYEEACFDDGYMILRKGGKCGMLDYELDIAVPFVYDNLELEHYHIVKYYAQGETGIIFPETGAKIVNVTLERYTRNLVLLSQGDNYLVADRTGKIHFTVAKTDAKEFSVDGNERLLYDGRLPNHFEVFVSSYAHPWASDYIQAAREKGLLPGSLDQLYTLPVSRADFCELAMDLLAVRQPELYARAEEMFTTNQEALEASVQGNFAVSVSAVSFYDMDPIWSMAEAVECAAKLGIVTGYPDGSFHPFHTITRQEAATILQRLAKLLELEANGEPLTFTDMNTASEYAREAISAVSAFETPEDARLMNGVGEGKFDLLGSYTVEQAIVTMYRLYLLGHDGIYN